YAEIEEARVDHGSVRVVDALRATGEDEARGVIGPYLFRGYAVREYLAVDTQFPDLSRDELRVLGAEIENDDDFLVVIVKTHALFALLLDPVVRGFLGDHHIVHVALFQARVRYA